MVGSNFEEFLNSLGHDNDKEEPPKIGVEPSAEHRQAAHQIYGLFSAYVDSGFTRWEAMKIILAHISTSSPNNG